MVTEKKEKKLFPERTKAQSDEAKELLWLKSKRSSTELSIMEAGRQPSDKKK